MPTVALSGKSFSVVIFLKISFYVTPEFTHKIAKLLCKENTEQVDTKTHPFHFNREVSTLAEMFTLMENINVCELLSKCPVLSK